MRVKYSIWICLSFYVNPYISLTGDDNEGTTNDDDEKSGKKGKRLRKKNLVVEEAVVGKRGR